MGQIVSFAQLSGTGTSAGVSIAPITKGETKEMTAELVRVDAGKLWKDSAPPHADCYLFALSGSGALAAGDVRHRLTAQTFATIEQSTPFSVESDGGAPLEIVKVIAPPQPNRLAGFTGKVKVAERDKTPVLEVPEEKKQRVIFVGHHAVQSERAHAMIVVYKGDTHTPLHHHPNAESLFVLLDGAVEFTVNGKQEVLKPGQAVYFGANDVHQLHTASGHSGASFLEFHIPAAYETVKLAG